MKRTCLAVWMLVAACGGGGGGGADASSNPADGGTPDALAITGNTAKGVYPVAVQMATAVMPNATLYTIAGQRIDAAGEVDPTTNQSWWRFTFLDLGQGQVTTVFWTQGEFTVTGPMPMNTETLKVVTTEWIDSGEAMAKLTGAGYVSPMVGDPYSRSDALLAMFVGNPMDFRTGIAEPLWRVSKLNTPPGMTPTTEEWWTTYWAENSPPGYLVCNAAGMCSVGP